MSYPLFHSAFSALSNKWWNESPGSRELRRRRYNVQRCSLVRQKFLWPAQFSLDHSRCCSVQTYLYEQRREPKRLLCN